MKKFTPTLQQKSHMSNDSTKKDILLKMGAMERTRLHGCIDAAELDLWQTS